MNALIELINRQRSKGYKYEQIKEQLIKLGNTNEDADNAIAKYVKEMCGSNYNQHKD